MVRTKGNVPSTEGASEKIGLRIRLVIKEVGEFLASDRDNVDAVRTDKISDSPQR